MINAHKEYLYTFFHGTLKYVVPFFQRSYVWKLENWEILWEHLNQILEKTKAERKAEHFIGTIITKQRPSESISENKMDLIDGQQRLTTFAILLKAISDKASGSGMYYLLKANTLSHLIHQDSKGIKHIRIEHSKNDKEYFEAIMLDKDLSKLENKEHRVLQCYSYFILKLEGFSDEKLEDLKDIILNNIPVISMLLEINDDEQAIFDTINSLGVKLSTGELLKNYIFADDALKPFYNELWEETFEEDEDIMDFWAAEKTTGRIKRTNMEVLLYCYLMIEKGESVELEKLFNGYKVWLKTKSYDEKLKFLQDLKQYAHIYRTFPSDTELAQIKFSQHEFRFFHIIENLEITTVYPLVLYIYKNVTDDQMKIEMLRKLESYIVRRNVCGYTTKNYNKTFVSLIEKLKNNQTLNLAALNTSFAAYTEETNKFPTEAEVKDGFINQKTSNSHAREILFCISLYHVYNPRNDVTALSSQNYSTEHMMPVKWEKNWPIPLIDEAKKQSRNKKVPTLGNLTLVTKNLNSSMRNESWTKKKAALQQYSLLRITTDYMQRADWNETTINERAISLAEDALIIWV